MKKSFNDGSTVLHDLTEMIGGYQIGVNLCLLNSNNEPRMYQVSIGTGLVFLAIFIVNADSEQDAVDKVADFIEDNELNGLFYSNERIIELSNEDETIEEYVEAHNLVSCGNHGVYIDLQHIEEI